jgi:hypothetical protein
LTCENVSILRIEPEESMVMKVPMAPSGTNNGHDVARGSAKTAEGKMVWTPFVT